MKIHLLSGFLGSGKTTAIQQACIQLIKKGNRVGVITNDQGIRLVDGDFFEHLNIPGRQVVNGCFCCNYNDLDDSIQSLININQPDIIFAESVGSCTDIVATVMKPLLQYRPETKITISTFADIRLLKIILKNDIGIFDKSVRYIYLKQLEEAEVIVVSKIDLVNNESLQEIKEMMNEKYGDKILLYQNSFDAINLQQWLRVLDNKPFATPSSLHIDYDIYGEGEAKLAWQDQELEIYSTNYNATQAAIDLMNTISREIQLNKYPVGHLKFLLNGETKFNYTYAQQEKFMASVTNKKDNSSKLLINARVQTSPKKLSQLMSEAVTETEMKSCCKMSVKSIASFQPGYPKPTYRISG
ncbi:MAG: GTP-binding protein [Ferruginibacter sp.]